MNCGACYACRKGAGNCCVNLKVLGVMTDGGLRDRFVLRAHFEPGLAPARIWTVADAFHRDLDERTVDGAEVVPDRCGDLRVEFDDMLPGHGYGIQWD